MEAETTEVTYCPAAYATLFNKGLERVVEMSKTSLDLAVEQNAEVLASYKKALKASSLPGLFLFDLAGQAFEGYVTLQKSLLDLAVEQSTAVLDAAKECSHDASKAKAGISNMIQQSVDRTGCSPEFGSGLCREAGQGSERDREAAARRRRHPG